MRRAFLAAIVIVLGAGAAAWWLRPGPPPAPAPAPPPAAEQEPDVGDVVVEWQSAFLEALAESARQAEAERAAAALPPPPPPEPTPPSAPRPAPPRRIALRGDPEKPPVLAPPPPRGALDRETVKQAVASVNANVKDCYRQGLKQDPTLAGTVLVSFVIEQKDGEGRISGAELDPEGSTMTQPFVQACLLEALGKARFPLPETSTGRQRVRFPFTLRTRHGP